MLITWQTYFLLVTTYSFCEGDDAPEISLDVSGWKHDNWTPLTFTLIFQNNSTFTGNYQDLIFWLDETRSPLKDVPGFSEMLKSDKATFDAWKESTKPKKHSKQRSLQVANKQWELIERWFASANITVITNDRSHPL